MLYTKSDLINVIIAKGTTAEEDTVISGMEGVASLTATYNSSITTSGISGNIYILLDEDITSSGTNAYFTMVSGVVMFQRGVALFDTEEITFSGVSGDGLRSNLLNLGRGYNSTTPAEHLATITGTITTLYIDVNNSYFVETITSGTASGVAAWRAINYENTYNQALRAQQGTVITDNDSPHLTIPAWDSLMDGVQNSGGMSYDSGDWVKYEFPDTMNVNGLSVYIASTANCYFAYSENNVDWTFLKAEADHTLDANNKMLAATNEAAAQTNYLTLTETAGSANNIRWPVGVRAKYVKMFVRTNTTSIYELVYSYVEIPEQLVVDYLSAISADVGLLTAGVIQSSNFATTGGVKMDLDNDKIEVYDSTNTLRVRLGKLA